MAAPVFNNSPKRGSQGVPYLFTWDITASPAATTQIIEGTLPPGLTLSDNINNNNPVISGTPETFGDYVFKVYSSNDGMIVKEFCILILRPFWRGFYSQE